MRKLLKCENDTYLITNKKMFVKSTNVYRNDITDAFDFAYGMTFGKKGAHRPKRSGGKKNRKNGEIFVDAFHGKIAEFGVYNYLKKEGCRIGRPDIKCEPRTKWDSCDFCVEGIEVAVKSTRDYGQLLLLEVEDWNREGQYIPNLDKGHAEYDYFILARVQSKLKDVMVKNKWLYSNYVPLDKLNPKIENIFFAVNIAGYITRREFVDEVIDSNMIIEQGNLIGTSKEKLTEMDACNYYVQAGDLHEIEDFIIDINRRKKS